MKVYIVHERLKVNHGNDVVFLREIFAEEAKALAYCEYHEGCVAEKQKAYAILGVTDRMFTISEMDVIE